MKVYFAGPLFSQAELEFNAKITSMLRAKGFEVFLPQEHSDDVPSSADLKDSKCGYFKADIQAVDGSDVLLIVLDGRVPDEGACFELGYAYARGKTCVGLKTDVRVAEFGGDNAMIVGSLGDRMFGDVPSIISELERIAEDLPGRD